LKLPRLLAVISIVVGTSLFSLPFANATSAYTTVVCANAQGQTHTAQIGWDNNQSFFDGKGYIPAFYCTGGYAGQYNIYVSDNLSDSSLGYYAGLVPNVSPTPMPVVEPTPEPSVPPTPEPEPTPTVEPSPSPEPVVTPEPSPEPSVEPTPQPLPLPEPTQEPTPQPSPEPAPEPTPIPSVPQIPVVTEPELPPAVEPLPPVEEPQTPAPEPEPIPSEPPPVPEPAPEPPAPAPEPEPEPEIVQVDEVELEALPPDTPVELSNGVVVTAQVAIAVQLLQDPAAMLQEIFTNPGAALAALGSVGADMTPEVREQSEKVVVSAIIAGGIATQAAASAAAGATYRRKP